MLPNGNRLEENFKCFRDLNLIKKYVLNDFQERNEAGTEIGKCLMQKKCNYHKYSSLRALMIHQQT